MLASSPNAFTPNELVDGVLSHVTCLSPTDCFAVGNFTNGYGDMTLIEHWNGTLWLTMPSPNLLSLQDNILSGVTCTSGPQCFAVGAYTNQTANGNFYQTLIEQWDGKTWSIAPSPNINPDSTQANNQLLSVTCTSATNCFAVGYYSTGTYYPGSYRPEAFIEQWNGTSSSLFPSPNISATQDNSLYVCLTCILATNCFAVGFNSDNSTGIAQTLIEQWDGETWWDRSFAQYQS